MKEFLTAADVEAILGTDLKQFQRAAALRELLEKVAAALRSGEDQTSRLHQDVSRMAMVRKTEGAPLAQAVTALRGLSENEQTQVLDAWALGLIDTVRGARSQARLMILAATSAVSRSKLALGIVLEDPSVSEAVKEQVRAALESFPDLNAPAELEWHLERQSTGVLVQPRAGAEVLVRSEEAGAGRLEEAGATVFATSEEEPSGGGLFDDDLFEDDLFAEEKTEETEEEASASGAAGGGEGADREEQTMQNTQNAGETWKVEEMEEDKTEDESAGLAWGEFFEEPAPGATFEEEVGDEPPAGFAAPEDNWMLNPDEPWENEVLEDEVLEDETMEQVLEIHSGESVRLDENFYEGIETAAEDEKAEEEAQEKAAAAARSQEADGRESFTKDARSAVKHENGQWTVNLDDLFK